MEMNWKEWKKSSLWSGYESGYATWGVVATKMSEGSSLKSLTLLKRRPSQEDSKPHKLLTQFV